MINALHPLSNVSLALTVDEATRSLERWMLPRLPEALSALTRVRLFTQALQAYQELQAGDPETQETRSPFQVRSLLEDVSGLERKAFELVNGLFPLDDLAMEDQLLNGDELYIAIAPQGFPWTYEELCEAMEEPERFPAEISLAVFLKYLDVLVGEEAWQLAAERFGWQVDVPACLARPVEKLDTDRLFARLEEAGLASFKAAFEIVWGATGNYFLDYNPYEEGYGWEPIPFDAENVRKLAEEWRKAQPILQAYQQAEERVRQEPALLSRLAGLYESCLIYANHPRR
jgi:hypothetical protein